MPREEHETPSQYLDRALRAHQELLDEIEADNRRFELNQQVRERRHLRLVTDDDAA